mmetsp:Transcript_18497/g.25720  ORF Transcript_18497/g.25720 Transcript_18497/m.25720 type:complete len:257 (-) Transcript_18497:34-804(-)
MFPASFSYRKKDWRRSEGAVALPPLLLLAFCCSTLSFCLFLSTSAAFAAPSKSHTLLSSWVVRDGKDVGVAGLTLPLAHMSMIGDMSIRNSGGAAMVMMKNPLKAASSSARLRGGSSIGGVPGAGGTESEMEKIAKWFVNFYYQTFDTNRENLVTLYTENSMLTFEGQQIMGAQNIQNKLKSLPFRQVQHKIVTMDVQPSPSANGQQGIIVFICGDLTVDGGPNALKFSQVFQLLPSPQGGSNWFVQNDIFRLNYG